MKKSLLALTLAVSLAGLAGCSGGSNSNSGNGGNAPPPVVTPPPPPPIDTRFETFVKAILATTSETGSPVVINDRDFTFNENFSAYADLFGG